ncbi:MAG: thioesterase family protein [Sphingomonadaceae bacterium]|nr:thioesterase family protein [Sphingomonadaceae bacterium]
MAQALVAALSTVADRPAHSLHGHFLRAGDGGGEMLFEVEMLREGRSFSTRQVTALQDGRKLFIAIVSAQSEEEGLVHQYPMPQVPSPDGLRSERDLRAEALATPGVAWAGPIAFDAPIELRPVTPRDFVNPSKSAPVQHFWVRPTVSISRNPIMAQAVLAYISDMMLLSTGLLPHGIYWSTTAMDSASLDHTIWFHGQPNFDDWTLWSLETPWTGGSRALARGTFYDRTGRMIGSVAQEGLLRLR